MKRIAYIFVCLLLLASCAEKVPDSISIDKGTIVMSSDGGKDAVKVTSSGHWIVSGSASWCQPSITDGEDGASVEFTVEPNDETDDRSVRYEFKCGSETDICEIRQEALRPYLKVNTEKFEVPQEGQTIEISVESNIEYSVSCPDANWIKESENRSVSTRSHCFIIEANEENDRREAKIIFSNDRYQQERFVTVIQNQKDLISIDKEKTNAESDGGTFEVKVTHNVPFECEVPSSCDTWIHIQQTRAVTEDRISFTVDSNKGIEQRTGKIIIKDKEGILSCEHTVCQMGSAPALSLSSSEINSSFKASDSSVEVYSNLSWKAESNVAWCHVSPESSEGNGSITLKVDENTSGSARNAEVTVSSIGIEPTIVETIKVSQEAKPALEIAETTFSTSYRSASKSIDVKSNISWKAESDVVWCHVSPASSEGNGNITLKVDENTSGSARNAEIRISSIGVEPAIVRKVNVSQDMKPEIEVSGSEYSVSFNASSKAIEIRCNTSWTASSDVSWCQVSPASSNGNGKLTLTVDKNSDPKSRLAIITLKAGSFIDCQIEKKIVINQGAYNDFSVGDWEIIEDSGTAE